MRKFALIIFAVLAFTLLMGAVAYAATPQDIYNDWVANGTLTGSYTDEELNAYLNDATIHQYGDPGETSSLDTYVRTLLASDERQDFPFTGAQMLVLALGGLVLVGGGVALRRTARR